MSDDTPRSLDDLFNHIRETHPEVAERLDAYDLGYELARAVLSVRRDFNLTQEQVAERAGMTQQQIADIERMKANPTARTMTKLCDALDLKLRFEIPEAS